VVELADLGYPVHGGVDVFDLGLEQSHASFEEAHAFLIGLRLEKLAEGLSVFVWKNLLKASTVGFRANLAVRPITGINTTEIPMMVATSAVKSMGATACMDGCLGWEEQRPSPSAGSPLANGVRGGDQEQSVYRIPTLPSKGPSNLVENENRSRGMISERHGRKHETRS